MASNSTQLLFGGPVRTGEVGLPLADWVRVESGRIAAVGRGAPPDAPGAARFDLRGRTLVPAFHDAHVHLSWIATSLLGCDVSACDGVVSVLETLAAYRGPGRGRNSEWVVGYGFDESEWPDPRLPTRADIDRVELRRPVLLQRVCGHVGVVNSAGLARITAGEFTDRDLGRLAEDDLYQVNDRLRPDPAALERVLPDVAATLHRHGITAVHDVTSPEMLLALTGAAQHGALAMRVSAAIPTRYLGSFPALESVATSSQRRQDAGRHSQRTAAAFFAAHGFAALPLDRDDPWLRVLGVKLFLDGSLGAHTAALREPYADAPETRGALLYTPRELTALACEVDAAGLQLMVHAIGDAAIDLGLDALEPLAAGGNPHRHRLEHIEVTPPDLVRRLADSGLLACVQPNFAGRWSRPGGMNEQRLGARLEHCNAYRALQDAGVELAFGSDCMPLGPLYGLRSAVEHPLVHQQLDAAAALALYTAASARMTHADAFQGRIAPGFRADLVALSYDPLASGSFTECTVTATWLGGRLVHEVEGAGKPG